MDTAVQPNYPNGTRFRLFPQAPLKSDSEPEVVWVSSPAGSVFSGPSDDRMYVVDPIGKHLTYGPQIGPRGSNYYYMPPWQGAVYAPARPDEQGHFDYLDALDPEFRAAHLFGSAHFVLDIWETYFGRVLPWHFRDDLERLELVLLPAFDNAHIGHGFMEVGSEVAETGELSDYSLNFDTIAHEMGHGIIYSVLGIPTPDGETGEYLGFHESAADLVAIVSSLHFDSVIDSLLETTHGNLYTFNRLNRIVELTKNTQIRLAANTYVMEDFANGWRKEHQLSQPLTGAMFDIFVDIFHEQLLCRGLITEASEDIADQIEYKPEFAHEMQSIFDESYIKDPAGFKAALIAARDVMGFYLAETWSRLPSNNLFYRLVADKFIEVDDELNSGVYNKLIRRNFYNRGIGLVSAGPQLEKLSKSSHLAPSRTAKPQDYDIDARKMTFFERVEIAKGDPILF